MESQSKMLTTQINKIRDILRTIGIVNDESIKHCIAFISLRILTPRICKILKIDEMYAFENFEGELDDEELRTKFYKPDVKLDCYVKHLRKEMGFKSFKFRDIIHNLHFRNIFECLKEIDTENLKNTCDIIGVIYEIHLGTGAKSTRDLGQFFTNRLVIKFMIELTEPKLLPSGQIETIVDPTMGTGGFLTMAVDYLNKQGKVNWQKNSSRIFGYDISEEVTEYAVLNLLLETGRKFENLYRRDTLNEDICVNELPISCDIILANEPMGLKGLKYADFCDRIKEVKLPGTKAEPAFIQLFTQALNKNGRCAVIVPDGFLFNDAKQYKSTREYLIENFEVREIIKMNDKNFFINTGVNASIVYFANVDIRVEMVKFSEISLNEDATEIVYKEVREVTYDEIREKDYNLNPNLYVENIQENREDVKYMRLGDICEINQNVKNHDTSYGKQEGLYKFYTGGVKTDLYVDTYDYSDTYIIQNRTNGSGKCNLCMANNFSVAKQTIIYKASNLITTKYIYYYLKSNINVLEKGYMGTNHKNISKLFISNIEIPLPALEKQKELVEKLDALSDMNKTCETLISQLNKKFEIYINAHTQNADCVILKELCNFKRGKSLLSKNYKQGDVPVIGGGKTPSGYHNVSNRNANTILCASSGSAGYISMYNTPVWATDCFSIHSNSEEKIIEMYIFYILKSKQDIIYKLQVGSAQQHVYSKDLEMLKIPVVSSEKQKEIVNMCDSIFLNIENLKTQISENESLIKIILL